MKNLKPISYKFLRKSLNPSKLKFHTTAELKTLDEFLGQERALDAIRFGIGIKSQGYNIYAMGPPGIGKHSLISKVLTRYSKAEPIPSDWCYVHNFESPEKPIAIQLPAGMGVCLQQELKIFINELSTSLISIFESDEYQNRMKKINSSFNKKKRAFAKANKNKIKLNKVPRLYKEKHQEEIKLLTQMTTAVVEPIVNKLKNKYLNMLEVLNYLNSIQLDIISHVNDLIKRDENTGILTFSMENPILIKYQINLIVDNSKLKSAPVILEENPSYPNLINRVEHTTQYGNLVTNFRLIKAGTIYQANGGYLIIEARKIKKNYDTWEGLKRALYTKKITVDPIKNSPDYATPISLEPMAIPLNLKVILLGDRHTYYSFFNRDSDFNELFKVIVDFDEQINRNKKNVNLYTRLIATILQRKKLRSFDVKAVACIIEQSSRIAEDAEKLTTHIRIIDDLITEADYWASLNKRIIVSIEDVKQAIEAQIHRLARAKDLYYEDINRKFIMISTKGKVIGQVNCLSVIRIGNYSFGHPTRVTAIARKGKGKIIDIQREIKLSGPIHSKSGFIIANFIAGRYNKSQKLSLFASISFEQIYGRLEGDSASVGEVCALLSALSNTPIKQSVAVTGSMDQYGRVQSVGGVNEKIEGFFDICIQDGLDGSHGVIIPKINVKNLMLREDIVSAAKNKKFSIFAIENIDEAITLLTGMDAGKKVKDHFEINSINNRVEEALIKFEKGS